MQAAILACHTSWNCFEIGRLCLSAPHATCLCIACRGEALKVVMDFTANAGLLQVAQLLYQLEVMLLQSRLSTTKVSQSHLSEGSVAYTATRLHDAYHHKDRFHTPSQGASHSYCLKGQSHILPQRAITLATGFRHKHHHVVDNNYNHLMELLPERLRP